MKKVSSRYLLCAGLLLGFVGTACGGSQKDAKEAGPVERVKGVDETVAAFKAKHESIAKLFSTSAGYVVMPTIGEGAFIIGGGHGSGEAFEGGKYVGTVTINEVSVGAQVGGQSYSQVVFFETPVDFKRLKDNAFEFGAGVSAIAADQGVSKDGAFKDGVATFIIPKKGLMASAAVGGQHLDFEAAK
jgi:lipid-binding SYLF domain-containing protein